MIVDGKSGASTIPYVDQKPGQSHTRFMFEFEIFIV